MWHPTDPDKAVAGSLRTGMVWSTGDGGQTWAQATHASAWQGRIEVAYAAADPDIVYASINLGGGQIWRSTDGGASFTARQSLNSDGVAASYLGDQGWYGNVLWAGDPTDADLIVVGGVDLWRSTDGGDTVGEMSTWWSPDSAHADQHAITSHPGYDGVGNRTVLFGNDGGVYRAADVRSVGNDPAPPHDAGWQNLNNSYGVTQFYAGAVNANGTLIGGAQDNGTLAFHPHDGTNLWKQIFGGDGGFCAADPQDPQTFYGEYVFLNVHRNLDEATTDDTTGDRYISGQFFDQAHGRWDWKPVPFRIPDAMTQRAAFIAPFTLDPNNSNAMLAGGESLWRTSDLKTPNTPTSGPRWTQIKSPVRLAGVDPSVQRHQRDHDRARGTPTRSGSGTRTARSGAPTTARRRRRSGCGWTASVRRPSRPGGSAPRSPGRQPTWSWRRSAATSRTTRGAATTVAPPGAASERACLPAPVRAVTLHPRVSDLFYLGTELGALRERRRRHHLVGDQRGPDELLGRGPDLERGDPDLRDPRARHVQHRPVGRLSALALLRGTRSELQRGLVVRRVVAAHLACRCEVAAEVRADSRDRRSGQGEPGPRAVPSAPAGDPRRGVDADGETVGDRVDEADPLLARPCFGPLRPSGPRCRTGG